MKGMPFSFQVQGVVQAAEAPTSYWKDIINNNKRKQPEGAEPCSVLDHRSPSPPTSTSTLSSSLAAASSDTAGVAAISDNNHNTSWPVTAAGGKNAEWASDLPPISKFGLAAADWDSIISDPPSHENSFLRWIMDAGNLDDDTSSLRQQQQQQQLLLDFPPIDPAFAFNPSFVSPSVQSLPPLLFQEPPPPPPPPPPPASVSLPLLQPDHAPLLLPPNPKRHNADVKGETLTAQQQSLVDQLFKAAELVEAGDSFGAREILARLNHQLSSSPVGLSPLVRSLFLFTNALHHLLLPPSPLSNPLDVLLKLSCYKSFSEISPLIHFTNFTLTQTLLEETAASDHIHIVDFDLSVGGHWSSFMQEIAHRSRSSPSAVPSLKITAFVSPTSSHPFALHLIANSLSSFASELNIPFVFNLLSLESFNPNELLSASPNETIAVNLPIGSHYRHPFPFLLQMVRQLKPKVIVSFDQGCDRSDLPFPHHFLHCFQSCMLLLDSLDAMGAGADVGNNIERFLLQPRIEAAVLGRHRAAGNVLPWRASFAAAGFSQVQLSNFTEAQAECLLKRVQVRGFHVEKRQGSLFLYWQRGELGSVSAWRC